MVYFFREFYFFTILKWSSVAVILLAYVIHETNVSSVITSIECIICGVRVTRSLVLCVCFVDRCLSFWPLCCLSFFDLRNLITPLLSSNSPYPYFHFLLEICTWDQPVKVTMTIYRIDLLSTIQARLIYEQYSSVCC
jgi:hypothetical protein